LLVNLLNPYPGTLARPSTPKVLRDKEHAPTPFPSIVFTFGLAIESIQEFGVRHKLTLIWWLKLADILANNVLHELHIGVLKGAYG
jgi:hypothetical protein